MDIEGLHACEPSLGDYVKEILVSGVPGHQAESIDSEGLGEEASGDDEWRVIAWEVLGHICVELGA